MADIAGQGISLNAYEALVKVLMKWALATQNEGSNFLDTAHQAGQDGRKSDIHDPILDAEHILTFLLPQNEVADFRIPRSKESHFHPDVATAISSLSSTTEAGAIPENIFRRLMVILLQYFLRHLDEKDGQLFGGAAYFKNADINSSDKDAGDQAAGVHKVNLVREASLTEAYTYSITLCIATMTMVARFMDERELKTEEIKTKGMSLDDWRKERLKKIRAPKVVVDGDVWNAEIAQLKWRDLLVLVADLASKRLTAAMLGLVASFAVSKDVDKEEYKRITRRPWSRHNARLMKLKARFEALGYSWEPDAYAVECGWSWGPLHPDDLPKEGRIAGERTYDDILRQARALSASVEVHAEKAPYFYFTVSALDGIADLSSEAVKNWELLDAKQSDLANRLTNLADLTRAYWSELAFGEEGDDVDWPVSEFPWSPSDTDRFNPEVASSEYWNLYLLRISAGARLKSARSVDSGRVVENLTRLLTALAEAARITRPSFPPRRDAAVQNLHLGFPIRMNGTYRPKKKGAEDDTETGKVMPVRLERKIYDFAPQLLKVCAEVMDNATDAGQRDVLAQLVNGIWAHLISRSDGYQVVDDKRRDQDTLSWDNPYGAFPEHEGVTKPPEQNTDGGRRTSRIVSSWSFTERVIEALVAIHRAQERRPPANAQLKSMVSALITQLEFELKRVSKSASTAAKNDKEALGRLGQELDAARKQIDESPGFSLVKAMAVAKQLSD